MKTPTSSHEFRIGLKGAAHRLNVIRDALDVVGDLKPPHDLMSQLWEHFANECMLQIERATAMAEDVLKK